MSRLEPIAPHGMSDDMRREWEILTNWRAPHDGVIGGPYDAWLRSPELLHRLQGLGGFMWERTALDRGLVEYLIALTSRHWRCNVEWRYHVARAREFGVAEETLEALRRGEAPAGPSAFRLGYHVAEALLANASLGDDLYAEGRAVLGERGLTEVAGLVGYYSLVAFTLRLFEIESEPAGPFRRPADYQPVDAEPPRGRLRPLTSG